MHKLGYGGSSTNWLARNLEENRNGSRKVLLADVLGLDTKSITRQRTHGVNHHTIVSLRYSFTAQEPNGIHQCLMLDEVGPVLKLLANRRRPASALMARVAARHLVEGVEYLHSIGICHGGKTILIPVEVLC